MLVNPSTPSQNAVPDTRAAGELTNSRNDLTDNSQPLSSETKATKSFCLIIILNIHFWLIKGRKWTDGAWKMLLSSRAEGAERVRDVYYAWWFEMMLLALKKAQMWKEEGVFFIVVFHSSLYNDSKSDQ